MKYYKTKTDIRAIETGQEFLIQKDWIKITKEEMLAIINPPKTEEEILNQKINEANDYLASTEWVENYKLRHDLKLELIPEDSTKWEKINKREEYKTFLRELK